MNVKQPQRFVLNSVFAATMACYATHTLANPSGGTVVGGNATFNQQGSTLIVTNTPGTIINWQQFSIGPDELTKFIQQNSNSAVLNRIVGQDPSQILGQLQSNGRVFLINPNGIVFGQGAKIDTAGLVASTLNMSDADFQAGKLKFQGASTGSIQNAANITTPSGGFVYLIAPNVQNNGVIVSPQGEILLAAGSSVELVDGVDTSLRVKLTAPGGQAVNVGKLIAEQGRIGVFAAAIQQQGVASADRAELGAGGKIVFRASQSTTLDAGSLTSATGGGQVSIDTTGGDTVVRGTVDVSNSDGAGGQAELLGDRVGLFGSAAVRAAGTNAGGSVLVGGDFHGANANVHNAQQTVMGSWASIDASATDKGDGGKVVLWADGSTQAYGKIDATGGVHGGNGGNAEVSGLKGLNFFAAVNLAAPYGKTGSLLLDPDTIDINSSGGVTTLPVFGSGPEVGIDFATGSGAYVVSPTALSSATADIKLQALSDITVSSAVNTSRNLELDSGGGIEVNAPISAGNITLSSTGYNIEVAANVTSTGTFSASTTSGSVDFGSSVSVSAPSMQLKASSSVTEDSASTFSTNNLVLDSASSSLYGTGNHIGTVSCSSSPCGSVSITNSGNINVGTFNATDIDIINSSGNVNVTGTVTGSSSIRIDSGSGAILNGGGQLTSDSIRLQYNGGSGDIGSSSSPLNVASSSGNYMTVQLGGNPISAFSSARSLIQSSFPVSNAYLKQTNTSQETDFQLNEPVTGTLAIQGSSNTLYLYSSSSVTTNSIKITNTGDIGTPSTSLSVGSLTLDSSGGTILLGSSSSISASSLSLAGNAIDFGYQGSLSFVSASSLTLKTDGFTGSSWGAVPITSGSLELDTHSKSGNLSLTQAQWAEFGTPSDITLGGAGSIGLPNVTASASFTASIGSSLSLSSVKSSRIELNADALSFGDLSADKSVSINVPASLSSLGSISAPSVSISAGSDIGSSGSPLFFTGSSLSLNSTGGSVYASMTGGSASLTAKGAVGLTATGNVSLGTISGSDVTISSSGALGSGGSISGTNVTLAATSIGSSNGAVSLSASGTLNATATQSGGGIYLNDSSGVGSATLTTSGGSVVFSAGGDASVALSTGGSVGDISLTSKGALTVSSGALQADRIVAKAGGNLSLSGALTGNQSIVLASGGTFTPGGTFTAPSLDLTTVADIGSAANPFIIQSSQVGLHATGSGSNVFAQGSGGTVSLSAGGGQVSYVGSGTSNVSLGGSYASLNLSTTAGDLTVGAADAGKGSIVFSSAGNLSLASASAGNVQLTAGGNVAVGGAVSAAGGALTATAASFSGSGSFGGDSVAITSGGAVGSAGQLLGVNAGSSLNIKTSNPGAGIFVAEADGVGLATLNAADGDIIFTSGGPAAVSASAGGSGHGVSLTTTSGDLTVQSLQSGGGALTLASGGKLLLPADVNLSATDLTLKSASDFVLNSTLTASSSLNIQSSQGSIQTGAGGSFSAPSLTLVGAAGVGSASAPVNVQTGVLNASSSGGGVFIASTGANALKGQINAGTGAVSVTTAGDLLGQFAGGTLSLNVGGTLGSSADRGHLAAANMQLNTQAGVFADISGDTTANVVTANGGIDLNSAGALTVLGSAGNGGGIVLASAGNLTFAGLQTTGDVTATTSGSILGSGTGDQLTAKLASFSAGGSLGQLSTKLQQIKATLGGGVSLVNSVPLEIESLTAGGDINIESSGGLTTVNPVIGAGAINLITHSPLTIGSGGLQAGTGISLQSGSGTGHDDITINGGVQSAAGDCSVQSGGSVLQNASIGLGGNGSVNVNAATGDVVMAPGTTTSTNGGSIGYTAQGNIGLASLDAGAAGSVSLNSTQGSVSSVTPGAVNIHAGSLDVQASGLIDLGADVPAGSITFKSASGYQVIRGKDGSLVPGSQAPTSTGSGGGDQQVVTAITNTTNTVTTGSTGATQDTTQKKIDKQQSDNGNSNSQGGDNGDNSDKDKRKKPKKC